MWADSTDVKVDVFYGGYSASKTLANVTIPSNFTVGSATPGAIVGGQPLAVSLDISAHNPGSKATVIVGVYSSNELIGVGVNSDASLESGSVTVTTGNLPDIINETVVKVFVLDSMSSVNPIVAPVTPAEQ